MSLPFQIMTVYYTIKLFFSLSDHGPCRSMFLYVEWSLSRARETTLYAGGSLHVTGGTFDRTFFVYVLVHSCHSP